MNQAGAKTFHGDDEGHESRRRFLKNTLALAAAATVSDATALFAQDGPRGAARRPVDFVSPRSRVVRVTSERIVPVRVVQKSLLKDAIVQGLCRLAGETDVRDAWHRILKPDDVILLKFNRSGATTLGTAATLAETLVESLVSAGWGPDRLVLLEAYDGLPARRRTRRPDMRWQGNVIDFGSSGKDSFLAALDQVTAIVNVPFLKTHNLATMTCCLKNLSHGLIRHPARFHAEGCDPAIGQIVASQPIRDKLRLNIVNALRVVFDRGPDVRENDIHTAGTLLLGAAPAACDAVGYGLLNEIRSLHKMGPLLPDARMPKQLVTAARLGLGQVDAERIDVENA